MSSEHTGMMIIVSSPSGVGKTTLVRLLVKRNKNFEISISNTTRMPRRNEIEGKDYYFTNEEKFNDLIKTKSFYDLGMDKDESYWMEKYCFTIMGIEPLLSIRSAKMQMKIAEVPSDEPKRIHGVRKLQIIRWGMAYLSQMLYEAFTNDYRIQKNNN